MTLFYTAAGTPEYLSPATVRNRSCGIEVDLWALGVVFFQMLLGYTPFGAPSPYLTFLRIKRAFLQVILFVFITFHCSMLWRYLGAVPLLPEMFC